MKKQKWIDFHTWSLDETFFFHPFEIREVHDGRKIKSLRHVRFLLLIRLLFIGDFLIIRRARPLSSGKRDEVRTSACRGVCVSAACNCLIIPVIKQVHVSFSISIGVRGRWPEFLCSPLKFDSLRTNSQWLMDWLNMTMPVHLFSSHYHQTSIDMQQKKKKKKKKKTIVVVLSTEVGACARYREQICVNGPSCACTQGKAAPEINQCARAHTLIPFVWTFSIAYFHPYVNIDSFDFSAANADDDDESSLVNRIMFLNDQQQHQHALSFN